MDGTLRQLITLVAYGNLYLNTPNNTPAPDLSSNSAFQYVHSLEFVRYESRVATQGTPVAVNTPDWFKYLRSVGVSRLSYAAFAWDRQDIPERIAVSFSNAISRAIEAKLHDGYECWYPRWNPGGQSPKPWRVQYRSLTFDYASTLPQVPLETVKQQLRLAIEKVRDFAVQSDLALNVWAGIFAQALERLDKSPQPSDLGDMLPERGYDPAARQIMAAASQANVFGGMGSWNDLGFTGAAQQKYEAVSNVLYEAIKYAFVIACNSFSL